MKRLSTLIVLSALSLSAGLVGRADAGCAEALETLGAATLNHIQEDFPALAVIKTANGGFSVRGPTGTQNVNNFPNLLAVLITGGLASDARSTKPVQIYLQGVKKNEAWNLLSSLRLNAAKIGHELDQVAYVGGSKSPPPPEIPTDISSGGGDGSIPRLPGQPARSDRVNGSDSLKLAIFRPLSERYNWASAQVQESVSATKPTPTSDFDPSGYSFLIVIPASELKAIQPKTAFSVFTFFRKGFARPRSDEIKQEIQETLKDESLQRATIQRAAQTVIRNMRARFPNSETSAGAGDLMLMELETPEPSRG